MAYYDYHCTKCGEIFEAEHSMDGPDPRSPMRCPVCRTAEVNKIFLSAPAVRSWFKSPRLAHHPDEKRPKYMPPVVAKEAVTHGRS
jgi:putative FmdB family regulatory protein